MEKKEKKLKSFSLRKKKVKFTVVVLGDVKVVNLLCKAHSKIQGDYKNTVEPHLYSATKIYYYYVKKKIVGVLVYPIFEELESFRKNIFKSLSAHSFLLCFDLNKLESLKRIKTKYYLEVKEYLLANSVTEIPVILCGVSKNGSRSISQESIDVVMQFISGDRYLESSFSDNKKIRKIFQVCANFMLHCKRDLNIQRRKKVTKKTINRILLPANIIRKRLTIFFSNNDSLVDKLNAIGKISDADDDNELKDKLTNPIVYESQVYESEKMDFVGRHSVDDVKSLVELPFYMPLYEFPKILVKFFKHLRDFQFYKRFFEYTDDCDKQFKSIIDGKRKYLILKHYETQIPFKIIEHHLKKLPEPICTIKFYCKFLASLDEGTLRKRISTIRNLLSQLPSSNREVISIILLFTKQIEKNCEDHDDELKRVVMNDFAAFFAPCIFWNQPPSSCNYYLEKSVMKFMLLYAEDIILADEQEFEDVEDDITNYEIEEEVIESSSYFVDEFEEKKEEETKNPEISENISYINNEPEILNFDDENITDEEKELKKNLTTIKDLHIISTKNSNQYFGNPKGYISLETQKIIWNVIKRIESETNKGEKEHISSSFRGIMQKLSDFSNILNEIENCPSGSHDYKNYRNKLNEIKEVLLQVSLQNKQMVKKRDEFYNERTKKINSIHLRIAKLQRKMDFFQKKSEVNFLEKFKDHFNNYSILHMKKVNHGRDIFRLEELHEEIVLNEKEEESYQHRIEKKKQFVKDLKKLLKEIEDIVLQSSHKVHGTEIMNIFMSLKKKNLKNRM